MNFLLAAGSIGAWLDSTFAGFDMAVFQFFGNLQNDFLNFFSIIISSLGSTIFVILLLILAIILIFPKKTRRYGLALIFAVIIGTLLTNVLIKPITLRIRPYNTLQNISTYFGWYQNAGMLSESDYSFPSGHTTAAFEIATALCISFTADKKKRYAWIFPVLALMVACARIYLMVHYPTDVIGGIIIGIIAGVAGFIIANALCKLIDRHSQKRAARSAKLPKERKHNYGKVRNTAIILAVVIMLVAAFIPEYKEAKGDTYTCAYDGDYKCHNEAETGDKYPAIDGKHYCKIHWKELSERAAAENSTEATTTQAETVTLPETTAADPVPAQTQTETTTAAQEETVQQDN